MKIALFKNIEHGFETVHGEGLAYSDAYIRLSEFIDVDFPRLADSIVVEAQIAALDKAETALRIEFHHKLNEIDGARANLRALTHTVQP